MPFHAKPGCPRHLVDVYDRAVNALPSSYLLPPVTGEVFTSIEACEQRLRGFALAEGFDIAHTGGCNKRVPGGRWQRVQILNQDGRFYNGRVMERLTPGGSQALE
jgi:hypothetical protein